MPKTIGPRAKILECRAQNECRVNVPLGAPGNRVPVRQQPCTLYVHCMYSVSKIKTYKNPTMYVQLNSGHYSSIFNSQGSKSHFVIVNKP